MARQTTAEKIQEYFKGDQYDASVERDGWFHQISLMGLKVKSVEELLILKAKWSAAMEQGKDGNSTPNVRSFRLLYELCEDLDIPLRFSNPAALINLMPLLFRFLGLVLGDVEEEVSEEE